MSNENERLVFCVHSGSDTSLDGLFYQGTDISWLNVNHRDRPWTLLDLTKTHELSKFQELTSAKYLQFEAPSRLSEEMTSHIMASFYERMLAIDELEACGFVNLDN